MLLDTTLLLSRASFLLKGASAVADFALYFNPALAANTVEYELSSSPQHDWAHLFSLPSGTRNEPGGGGGRSKTVTHVISLRFPPL